MRLATLAQAMSRTSPTAPRSNPKGGAHVAHDLLVQRYERHADTEILFWILLFEPRGDRVHVGAGAFEVSRFLQTGDNAESDAASAARVGAVDLERRENLGLRDDGKV